MTLHIVYRDDDGEAFGLVYLTYLVRDVRPLRPIITPSCDSDGWGDSNDVVTRRVKDIWVDRDIGHRDNVHEIVEIPAILVELTVRIVSKVGGAANVRTHMGKRWSPVKCPLSHQPILAHSVDGRIGQLLADDVFFHEVLGEHREPILAPLADRREGVMVAVSLITTSRKPSTVVPEETPPEARRDESPVTGAFSLPMSSTPDFPGSTRREPFECRRLW